MKAEVLIETEILGRGCTVGARIVEKTVLDRFGCSPRDSLGLRIRLAGWRGPGVWRGEDLVGT